MLIGVDLGGTTIKTGLVDFKGNIVRQDNRSVCVEKGYMHIINEIVHQIEKLIIEQNISIEDIYSIGIGVPGIVEYSTGKVIYCPNLLWKNIELGNELYLRLNKKVYVENDATVAGLAENIFGSTRNAINSVLLTLGTGIGSGIIIDKSIYRGSHEIGAEIGHMIIGENFYDCNCGNNGCFETFASATSIIRYSQYRIINNGIKSIIMDITSNNMDNITAKIIFDAAKIGDSLALETVDRMCRYLAIGIINIYNLLDPDIIALGGGVSNAGNFLLEKVKNNVSKMLFVKDKKYGEIVLAELGNKAGIIGAAFLGYNRKELYM